MASAAEQLVSQGSLGQFAKATELKKRIWFTLGTLVVFRLLSYVPLPGIDPRVLQSLFDTTRGGVMDFFNLETRNGQQAGKFFHRDIDIDIIF